MHSLHTCTLHNIETLKPLPSSRVRPSHCYDHTHKCSHVLLCPYLTSVTLQHPNWLLVFVTPYIILAPSLISLSPKPNNLSKSMKHTVWNWKLGQIIDEIIGANPLFVCQNRKRPCSTFQKQENWAEHPHIKNFCQVQMAIL